jgi:hypothetical protein
MALGGWRPVEIHEDLALNNAVWRSGGTAHQTHGLGYLRCRHGVGHTWEAESDRFLQDAVEQWAGFHPPPELPTEAAALEYYETVRPRVRPE